jgi:hypothetical protein
MKFYVKIDYKHFFYKLCIKYCLYVNNYKLAMVRNVEVIADEFNIESVLM